MMIRKTKAVKKSAVPWDAVPCSPVEFQALTDDYEEFCLLGYNAVKKKPIPITNCGGL
jgi:hypothetical protein